MLIYIVRRLLHAVIVILGVVLAVFLLLHLIPGGPARALLGPRASLAAIKAFNVANGYDRPVWNQYVDYVVRVANGNLGFSYHYDESVSTLLGQRLPKSILLVGAAVVIAIALAIPLGLLQASRRNKPVDHAITGVAFVGYSMPTFWLGLLLIQIFSVHWHLFSALAPQGITVGAVLTDPSALVLPVATLTIVTLAVFSRFVRSAAVESLVQDYVRTAREKGASRSRVLFRHVLPNSLLPLISLLGLSLPAVIAGAVVTETIFSYPGMGLLFWTGATTKDYPVLMGCILTVAGATVLGSLLADLLYGVVDPRVRRA